MVRAEVSKKNPNYISKHRGYELKHFCLQYPEWKRQFNDTADIFFKTRIEMVNNTAKETDPVLSAYILKGITENRSYDYLRNMMNIPCGKDYYYKLYRKFYYILDKTRQ